MKVKIIQVDRGSDNYLLERMINEWLEENKVVANKITTTYGVQGEGHVLIEYEES